MVKIQDKEYRKKKMAGGGLHSAAGSINPSVKALTVLVTVLLLAFQYDTVLNLFVLAACLIALLFFSEARLISVVRIMIPASIAAAGMKVSDVNEILAKLIPTYECNFQNAPQGKTFQECYDVRTVKPTQEYLEVYDRAAQTLRDFGLDID